MASDSRLNLFVKSVYLGFEMRKTGVDEDISDPIMFNKNNDIYKQRYIAA